MHQAILPTSLTAYRILMQYGQKIKIIPSVALQEMRLQELVGKEATVIEVVKNSDNTIRGCWVELNGFRYQGEQEWFLPFRSFVE